MSHTVRQMCMRIQKGFFALPLCISFHGWLVKYRTVISLENLFYDLWARSYGINNKLEPQETFSIPRMCFIFNNISTMKLSSILLKVFFCNIRNIFSSRKINFCFETTKTIENKLRHLYIFSLQIRCHKTVKHSWSIMRVIGRK